MDIIESIEKIQLGIGLCAAMIIPNLLFAASLVARQISIENKLEKITNLLIERRFKK